MNAIARLPMFGLAALAFLLICTVIAVAVFFAFKSGESGRTKLGAPAGCAIGCGLLGVAFLMALALLAVALVNLPGEALRHGPIGKVELQYHDSSEEPGSVPLPPDAPAPPDAPGEARLHATLELRPGADAGDVLKLFRQRVSRGLDVTVRTVEGPDGPRSVIEIDIPLDARARREVRELLDDIREDAPDLNLPQGVVLEIKSPDE